MQKTTLFHLYEFMRSESFNSDDLVMIWGRGELTHLSVRIEDGMMRVEINNSDTYEFHPKDERVTWYTWDGGNDDSDDDDDDDDDDSEAAAQLGAVKS
jgi:hypothetical protein